MARELTQEESQIVERLRGEHGSVHPYIVCGELVVVRKARPSELDMYNDKCARAFAPQGKRATQQPPSFSSAQRELALACIVHPADVYAKRDLFDKQAALPGMAATKAEDLASEGIEDIAGN